MDRTPNFVNVHWGRILNRNNATKTHSIFVKLKKKKLIHFYIINAIDENLANSESCPKYSEIVVRGRNLSFQVICQKMTVFEQCKAN